MLFLNHEIILYFLEDIEKLKKKLSSFEYFWKYYGKWSIYFFEKKLHFL